jgi:hypothetical protein
MHVSPPFSDKRSKSSKKEAAIRANCMPDIRQKGNMGCYATIACLIIHSWPK